VLNVLRDRIRLLRRANPVGVARGVLALGSLSTLLLTDQRALFLTFLPNAAPARCVGVGQFGLFCVSDAATGGRLVGTLIAVVMLVAVISGYGPRVLAIPHFYVAWSISQNVVLVEGGDQVNAAMTMLLIPWLFTMPRGNAYAADMPYLRVLQENAFAYGAAELIRVQLSLVYAIAAIAKLAVPQWSDGTAFWYWLQMPTFGLPPDVFAAIAPVLQHPIVMVPATYAVLVFELSLVGAIWTRGRLSRLLLDAGIAFHGGIAIVLGLWSFGVTMAGALLLCRALQPGRLWFVEARSRADHPAQLEGVRA
jgi:antimicrobial peptide system SdpB family protein